MFALFEDRLAPSGEVAAWLFDDFREKIEGDWNRLVSALEQAASRGLWAVVALDYELGTVFEPTAGIPPARVGCLWIFARRQCLDACAVTRFLANAEQQLPAEYRTGGVGGVRAAWTEADHAAAVQAIQDYIRAGDCYQVNLTFPLHFTYFGAPLALYARLRDRQPCRYGGLVADAAAPVLSLSPELFVSKTGDRITTRPMKGTAARCAGPEGDRDAAQTLENSVKNRAENLMIVDLLRNDLSRLRTVAGGLPEIAVSELFVTEAYPTVWQMVSQVEAHFPEGQGKTLTPEALLKAVFPCGSITGAPKVRAMQIIRELEPAGRGIYTGCLGWFAPDGDARLNVAIRTLKLTPATDFSGTGVLGVGGGIVQDSVAAGEWDECWLKAQFLTQLDPGLRLIETLRLERSGFPWLEAHLSRLATSAQWLGFACDEAGIRQQLLDLAGQLRAGDPCVNAWRVRLTLGRQGDTDVQGQPLSPEPGNGVRMLTFAEYRVEADFPLQHHKTTWRAHYDEALKRIADQPAIFDVLFLNTRNELVEGARSSLLVLKDGVWKTPPLASGGLPGIWRGEVLAGRIPGFAGVRESVLQMADLESAERIVCGNALRGAVEIGGLIFPGRIHPVHLPVPDKHGMMSGKP